MKKGYFNLMSIVVTLLIGVVGCEVSESADDIVASVGDTDISKEELYNEMYAQNGRAVLDQMIEQTIIKKEVAKEKIEIAQEELQKEYDNVANYYGGNDELVETLETNGMTTEKLMDNLKLNLSVKALLTTEIEITDEEMRTYFENNRSFYNTPEQVGASHILVIEI